jgi:predicted nucleic acid-binding protein
MLYLDSSVLAKRYAQEKGGKVVSPRFERGETIYTFLLTFAEKCGLRVFNPEDED